MFALLGQTLVVQRHVNIAIQETHVAVDRRWCLDLVAVIALNSVHILKVNPLLVGTGWSDLIDVGGVALHLHWLLLCNQIRTIVLIFNIKMIWRVNIAFFVGGSHTILGLVAIVGVLTTATAFLDVAIKPGVADDVFFA